MSLHPRNWIIRVAFQRALWRMKMMMTVAVVGTGPTGIYSLQQLLATGRRLAVTLF